MALNKGKQFELKFKEDFLKTVPGSTIDRLYDTTSGFRAVSNICDFIGYSFPNEFYLECKSTLNNVFSLVKLTQYDKLVQKVGIKGVRVGVIIWFIAHDKVVYVPISEITKMKEDGKKSVNIKMLADKSYNIIEIPSTKKRVFMDSDYSCLKNLKDGE